MAHHQLFLLKVVVGEKKVSEFKYLGSTVQSDGEVGMEVKARVQARW